MTVIEAMASAGHEAGRAWAAYNGDTSVPHWEDLPAETRTGLLTGAEQILAGTSPRSAHLQWMDAKLKDGWKYGTKKDDAKKEHPSLVPYDELPPVERALDYIFVTTCQVVRAAANGWLEPPPR